MFKIEVSDNGMCTVFVDDVQVGLIQDLKLSVCVSEVLPKLDVSYYSLSKEQKSVFQNISYMFIKETVLEVNSK